MVRRHPFPGIGAAAMRGCGALAVLLLIAVAPCMAAVQRLTNGAFPSVRPQVNSAGQVAWLVPHGPSSTVWFWDGSQARQLPGLALNDMDLQVSETGQVAWAGLGDTSLAMFLWDGTQVRELGPLPAVFSPWQMNPAGQIAWQGFDGFGRDVYTWDGTQTRQLTQDHNSYNPRINRAGQVTWESGGQIFLWDGRQTVTLTPARHLVALPRFPQINDAGWVVWMGRDDPASSLGLSLWDGTRIRSITNTPRVPLHPLQLSNTGTVLFETGDLPGPGSLFLRDGAGSHLLAPAYQRAQMNRAGAVVWTSGGTVFFWDGSAIRPLAQTGLQDPEVQINDAGEVVWQMAAGPTGATQYVRWDGSSTQVISQTPEDDDPGIDSKGGLRLSERGQIVWSGHLHGGSDQIFRYTPPAPGSLELDPPEVIGGRPVTGRVTLPAPAAPGGTVVQFSSRDPAVAAVPADVTIAAGTSAATFPVTTFPVAADTDVGISASAGGQSWMATLTVRHVGTPLPGGITQLAAVAMVSEPPRLNDAGQVVWVGGPRTEPGQIFFWTGGPVPTILRAATEQNGGTLPQLNNRGHLLWADAPGQHPQLFFWDGQAAHPFADVSPNESGSLNDQDQITWRTGPFLQESLWYWDGARARTFTQQPGQDTAAELNNLGHLLWGSWDGMGDQLRLWDGTAIRPIVAHFVGGGGPLINDRDQIIWVQNPPFPQTPSVAFWDNGVTRSLPISPFDNPLQLQLNNAGEIAWTSHGAVFLWNGAANQPLNPGGAPAEGTQLNDAGEVAWEAMAGGHRQIFLWDGSALRQLTQSDQENGWPQINNRGQVAWAAGDTAGAGVYLYTPPLSLAVDPSPLIAGRAATGTVTLDQPAPAGGVPVKLASRDSAVAVPASVTVPAGQATASFPITPANVPAPTRVILSAATADAVRPLPVQVLPLGLALQPGRLVGGGEATGGIGLPRPAPPGGLTLRLASDNPAATLPSPITVPAGESAASFSIRTSPVSVVTALHLTVTAGASTWTAALQLLPSPVVSLTLNPSPITGGLTATGTVTLLDPAAPGGVTVALTSDSPEVTVPATVTVPAYATQATFSLHTRAADHSVTARITAASGDGSESAVLQVVPVRLVGAQLQPAAVVSGRGTEIVLTLSGPAPAGTAVAISTDRPDLVQLNPTAFFATGATTGMTDMAVLSVAVPTDVTVTAQYGGVSLSTVLRLLPASLQSLQLAQEVIPGGNAVLATLTLDGRGPPDGMVVHLASDNPAVASVPDTAMVPGASYAVSFQVTTHLPPQETVVHISATFGGQSLTAALTVLPTGLASLTVTPTAVIGGMPAQGKITLTAPAPAGGIVVTLGDGASTVAAIPDSIDVPAGATTAAFSISTRPVGTPQYLWIGASYGGIDQSATLLVQPG